THGLAVGQARADDIDAPLEERADSQFDTRSAAIQTRIEQLGQAASAQLTPSRRKAVDAIDAGIKSALLLGGVQLAPERRQQAEEEARLRQADLILQMDAALAEGDELALARHWKDLADAGLLDTSLAELRRRVEADPSNVSAAIDLAHGAVGAMGTETYGPQMIDFAEQADDAFGMALELAPERNDLRYERAQALAQWPSFLGRRGQAIDELETIIDRGNGGAAAPARSYRLLGTLLFEQGAHSEAVDAWQRGAGAFPDHAGLQELLQLYSGR
ncbi:MAG: tetratricopeptide (TPR) repeat protein, partial [Planctomycetota bacterium]